MRLSTFGARLCCAALLAFGAVSTFAEDHDPPRTTLAVVVVVDQLRDDYLTRFDEYFVNDGFRRFTRNGAHFANSYYSYGSSATGPGHATIASGRLPRQHGIVANEWFLEPGAKSPQAAVFDKNAKLVGLPDGVEGKGRSPRMLIGGSLGDQFKLADRRSRVMSVAMKDRAAILLGGLSADGAFWWEKDFGRFVTSDYYMAEQPAWARGFNDEHWYDRFGGQEWKPLLDAAAYAGTHPLDATWGPLKTVGAAFPHSIPSIENEQSRMLAYRAISVTPFGNEGILEFAARMIESEKLGAGPAPDLVWVGLSGNDILGHVYGPESAETLDATIRTDRQLAAFFARVEKMISASQCLFAVTADHGVTSIPGVSARLRLGSGLIDPGDIIKKLNATLKKTLLGDKAEETPQAPDLVLGANLPWIYCDPSFDRLDEERNGQLSHAAQRVLRDTPGIEYAFSRWDLGGAAPSKDEIERWLAWRCYRPGRSGSFFIKLAPYWYQKDPELAGHTAGFSHDRHVPLLLAGARVRPGVYYTAADPTDLAPTIAAMMGLTPPEDAVGRVLDEALLPDSP